MEEIMLLYFLIFLIYLEFFYAFLSSSSLSLSADRQALERGWGEATKYELCLNKNFAVFRDGEKLC
jgi:hypothetical protein